MRLSITIFLAILIGTAIGQTDHEEYRDNLLNQRNLHYLQLIEDTEAKNEASIRLLETARLGFFGSMAANARYAETILELAGYPLEKRSRVSLELDPIEDSLDISPHRLANAQFAISALISGIMKRNTDQISQLEEQRRNTTSVDQEIKRIRQTQAQEKPSPPPRGMVKGIVYSDRPSALVGSDIVHKGTKIDDIEILEIRPHSIVFGTDSQTWEQQVGQQPSYQW